MLIGVIAIWAIAVCAAMACVFAYEHTPSAAAATIETWPEGTRLARATDAPTLVMFAHPKCSCTRASLTELAELMNHVGDKVHVVVVFIRPSDFAPGWEHTATWDQAAAITGVTVVADVDGTEATRFGARTSGQVVLYAADGQLLYAGGITSSRGHVGESVGRVRITTLLQDGEIDKATSPVFGCAL